jgi:hypothetical protein
VPAWNYLGIEVLFEGLSELTEKRLSAGTESGRQFTSLVMRGQKKRSTLHKRGVR